MYTIIFCIADVVALIVQAIGGATASRAVTQGKNPDKGGHVMLGGIVFQMIAIVFYTMLAMEFLTRVILRRPVHPKAQPPAVEPKPESANNNVVHPVVESQETHDVPWQQVRLVVLGLGFSTLCILIRSVYRTIELSNGFEGFIIHQQQLFNWLDGAMIVLALATWNILHPGRLLPTSAGW